MQTVPHDLHSSHLPIPGGQNEEERRSVHTCCQSTIHEFKWLLFVSLRREKSTAPDWFGQLWQSGQWPQKWLLLDLHSSRKCAFSPDERVQTCASQVRTAAHFDWLAFVKHDWLFQRQQTHSDVAGCHWWRRLLHCDDCTRLLQTGEVRGDPHHRPVGTQAAQNEKTQIKVFLRFRGKNYHLLTKTVLLFISQGFTKFLIFHLHCLIAGGTRNIAKTVEYFLTWGGACW